MAPNPTGKEAKINALLDGWEEHATGASFSELTLAQFKAKVQPSLDARDTIRQLELQLAAARVTRDNADVASTETVLSVVNSVKGSQTHGEDSALYASFGYVRKSDRRSGLTRSAQPETIPTVAQAA